MRFNLWNKTFVLAVLLIVVTFAAYAACLQNDFKTMDDQGSIVLNDWVKDAHYIPHILSSSFFGRQAYYRPLVHLSFMAEYKFFGLNAFYYYITNILLHGFNALVVFLILRRLTRSQNTAFFSALLFAVHPVHWEAVSNIPGRSILLCAFFGLLTFLFFIKAREHKWFYALAVVAFIPALLSKESGIVMPLILLAYQLLITRRETPAGGRWPRVLWPLAPFFALNIGYVLLRRALGITHIYYWNNPRECVLGVLTFLRSLVTFLRLLVLPLDLQFDRSTPLITGFLNVPAVASALLFGAIGFILWKFRKRVTPLVWFFLIWTGVELFPVSQLVAAIGVQPGRISSAEHFLYMPSVALFTLAVMATGGLYKRNQASPLISPVIFKTALAGVFAFFALTTVQQCFYSSNEIAMFEQALRLTPDNSRIRDSLGLAYAKLGLYSRAEEQFRRALEVMPDDAWALIGLGKALCDQGKFWEGISVYDRIKDAGGLQHTLEKNIRSTYALLARRYEQMLAYGQSSGRLHYSLGVVYAKQGRLEEAIARYEQALALDPKMKNALFNLGAMLDVLGRKDEAARRYQQLVDLDGPKDDMDYFVCKRLVNVYRGLGDEASALAAEQKLATLPAPGGGMPDEAGCEDVCSAE